MENDLKVYVRVDVTFDENGRMKPTCLTWEDGHSYAIDRVLDIRGANASKAGGYGDRYTVRVSGRETYLFFEHSTETEDPAPGRWFVERRVSC